MGALCSGQKLRREQATQKQEPQAEEKQEHAAQNVLVLWNSLAALLNRIDANVSNPKTQAQLKNLGQIRSTTETMIANQEKRRNRTSLLDPAFQYIVYQQIDKIGKLLGDYLLIDQAFEERNLQYVDPLSEMVNQIEVHGRQFKTKLGQGKHNMSTNPSNPNTSLK